MVHDAVPVHLGCPTPLPRLTGHGVIMSDDPTLHAHRAILCHFDSYSTALLFALWPDRSLLWPGPLPEGAAPCAAQPRDEAAAERVRQAVIDQLGVAADDLQLVPEFNECLQAGDETLQVHLLRFGTFEAPAGAIAPAGGSFKPLPALRGCAPVELNLLRVVFNQIIGGAAR